MSVYEDLELDIEPFPCLTPEHLCMRALNQCMVEIFVCMEADFTSSQFRNVLVLQDAFNM